jgi:LuxR family transcriptional regulator, maltose regulon positive regulatory protein
LNERREAAVQRPLTVVYATAGFGKTTAVAGWLADSGRPVAWLSLDPQDDDPQRLLGNIVAAFGMAVDEAGLDAVALDAAERAVGAGADLYLTCLPLLAEALAGVRADGIVLVLDDYQVLQTPAVHQLVRALLVLLAPLLPVLISTRTKPPLRLARRLAAHEATVITADQLSFGADETKQLLNGIHLLDLSEDEFSAVDGAIHGWPVGLSLLILAFEADLYGRRPETVEALRALSASQMVEYVIEEVTAELSEDQRRLRLYTSVLEQVNGPLATAVLLDARAPALLEDLREQGQFISADGPSRGWLRIHDLVRRPLQLALERQEPGMAAVLHGRASVWFEQNGMEEEAIHQGVAAGDSARVDQLLRRYGVVLAMARRTFTLRLALEMQPTQAGESIAFREAMDLLVQFLDGGDQSRLAARAWELHGRYADRPEVQMVTSVLVCSPLGGDVQRGIEAGLDALERFADVHGFTTRVGLGIAACLMLEGRIAEMRAIVEPLIGTGSEPAQIFAHALLARVSLREGDPATAEWHGRAATALLEKSFSATSGDFVWIRSALADALRVNGKLEEARVQLDRTLEAERLRPGSVLQGLILLSDAELSMAEGRRAHASVSARYAREIFGSFPNAGTGVWQRLEQIEAALVTSVPTAQAGSIPSSAELRVLKLLATTSNRALIAQQLYVSESTVKSHLRRLYRRLGATNRAEALAAAEDRGLLG